LLAHARALAALHLSDARKFDSTPFGPILDVELLKECPRAGRFDAAAGTPGHGGNATSARRRYSGRTRNRERAIERRATAFEAQGSVGLDRERTGRRVDCQFDFRTVALRASGGDAIGIALALGVEAALAFHRPQQRAQLAIERPFLQDNSGAAACVGDDGTSVGETQAIDRQLVGVEAGLSPGPVEPSLGVEPES